MAKVESSESRKVLFSFIPASGFTPDKIMQKEQDEMARKRERIYHGEREIEEDGHKKTFFIVEDVETGIVYEEIDPTCVRFVD